MRLRVCKDMRVFAQFLNMQVWKQRSVFWKICNMRICAKRWYQRSQWFWWLLAFCHIHVCCVKAIVSQTANVLISKSTKCKFGALQARRQRAVAVYWQKRSSCECRWKRICQSAAACRCCIHLIISRLHCSNGVNLLTDWLPSWLIANLYGCGN